MTARCVMVVGTTSGAGKSLLVTALCRAYARRGLRVAPFKAQNMSNNARVVAGGEIGSAQYFQALAALAEPDVTMNPVLLKPEADGRSQVVVLGRVHHALSATPWRQRRSVLWPVVTAALEGLRRDHDVVVIEGAGSPAEINLSDADIVNLRLGQHADARCLLVADIDRGGAFAHLYGTWALLEPAQRALLDGFVLNRFRGDETLLAPGPAQLEALTGVPTVAVVPMVDHGLPEEDGQFLDGPFVDGRIDAARFDAARFDEAPHGGGERVVAVVAYPRAANLDEFHPVRDVPGVALRWVRSPAQLRRLRPSDLVVLPGSKHTIADLAWLRATGLDVAVANHAGRGGAVLGVCGGLQLLGEAIVDPDGVEHPDTAPVPGLGLLPLVSVFGPEKVVRRTTARFGPLPGAWSPWSGVAVRGYEIHHGRTAARAGAAAVPALGDGLGWRNEAGNVLGVYLHGLFEDAAAIERLLGAPRRTTEDVLDGLADLVEARLAPGWLDRLLVERAG